MTTPTIFQFQTSPVRTVIRDGEPWFVAVDVCKALEYSNTTKALGDHLDPDEKANVSLGLAGSPVNIINESGLYALVLRSRKPEARKFAKWVTSEVLPTIRKTGGYQFAKNAGDVLSLEQADLLRDTMTLHCARLPKNQQGPFMVKGWSKLKSHFKVGYRQIPQEHLTEALSIVTRHAAEWEVVDDAVLSLTARNNLEGLCTHMEFLRSWFARIYPGLKALSPNLAYVAHDRFIDGVCFSRVLVRELGLKSNKEYAENYPWDGGFSDRLEYNRSFT